MDNVVGFFFFIFFKDSWFPKGFTVAWIPKFISNIIWFMYIFPGKHLPCKESSGYMIKASIEPNTFSHMEHAHKTRVFRNLRCNSKWKCVTEISSLRHLLMHIWSVEGAAGELINNLFFSSTPCAIFSL